MPIIHPAYIIKMYKCGKLTYKHDRIFRDLGYAIIRLNGEVVMIVRDVA